jgi:hypothetical protein
VGQGLRPVSMDPDDGSPKPMRAAAIGSNPGLDI